MLKSPSGVLVSFLQIAAVCLFLGRFWQHLFWDTPYRALFWDEQWMRPVMEYLLGIEWKDYVTDPVLGGRLNAFSRLIGWFFFLCAGVAFFFRRLAHSWHYVLLAGSLGLVFLAFLDCKEKFFQPAQFLEHALQFSTPFFLFISGKQEKINKKLLLGIKVAIAVTFFSHGLYAVAFYPRPALFLEMTMRILGLTQSGTIFFLNTAGWLDFLAALLLFAPWPFARLALVYTIGWGGATALARIWANFQPEFWLTNLHQWGFEVLIRTPHFIVPLGLFLYLWKTRR